MGLIQTQHLEKFGDFCSQMLVTRDYDPNYFIVKGVVESRGYSEEEIFRYCITFNGFYWFNSADLFFQDNSLDPSKMKHGTSRRGFRGTRKVIDFINAGMRLRDFVLRGKFRGETGWSEIYYSFMNGLPGCGPWSAFYLTDMMKVILGRPITSPNFGHLGSSPRGTGPNACLSYITGIPIEKLIGNEPLHKQIYLETLERTPWTGMEEMESCLCNYLSLHKGKYFVGRDIDRQIPMLKGMAPEFWAARKKYFPHEMLGELHGWDGIRKHLMGTYEPGKKWKRPDEP